MGETDVTTAFERRRAVVWVCDLQGSSAALNNPATTEIAEEFLKRFFWLSAVLVRTTGGIVAKWTGDGFLAAYDVPLDRDLGRVARLVAEAAWHLSFLINVTQLGLGPQRPFRVRHAIAYEPDAILVRHHQGTEGSTDIIGRSVVLAFRMSGLSAPFPGIVTQHRVVESMQADGSTAPFKRLVLTSADLLKHFKGEKWSTREIQVSAERRPRPPSARRVIREARSAISLAEQPAPLPKHKAWVPVFSEAMRSGPAWGRAVNDAWGAFIRDSLLGTLKASVAAMGGVRFRKGRPTIG